MQVNTGRKITGTFVIYKSYNIGIPSHSWVYILNSNDYQPPLVCFQGKIRGSYVKPLHRLPHLNITSFVPTQHKKQSYLNEGVALSQPKFVSVKSIKIMTM